MDINLVLCLEFFGEVFDERIINIATAEVLVVGGTLDGQLTLRKGDNRDREIAVSDIDKGDVTRVFGLRQIALGDTVAESSGGGVVDQTEDVEVGDGSGIDQRAALDIGVPPRDGNHDIGDVCLELIRCDIAQFAQVHRSQLGRREFLFLAPIVHLKLWLDFAQQGKFATRLNANSSIDINQLRIDEFLLELWNLRVGWSPSDEAVKRSDGVLEVGGLLCLC